MTEHPDSDESVQRYVYLVPKSLEERTPSGEVGVQDLWRAVWRGRWIVSLIAVLGAAAGAVYAFSATQWYRADVVLSPVSDKSISGSLSQLSSLGSLAGINIPSVTGGEPVAVLRSKSFAREFIEDENLLPVLFADKWNTSTGKWKVQGPDQPDLRDGVKYFDETVRTVTEDKKAGLVTLSIKWKNGVDAAAWANLLVKRLNDRLRTEAIREAQTSISYLQKEMSEANVVSLQQSIGRVLEGEMQKMALARANEEFAFKVVDSAVPPKRRVYPQRTLILVMSTLFGALIGVIIALVTDRKLGAPHGQDGSAQT